MPEVSAQEINSLQGTRLSDTPPWESYGEEFGQRLDPALQAEVDEYATRRHGQSSTQAKEELCRQRELNEDVAKEYQFLHPREYQDAGPRIGRVMHSSELIKKLRSECHVRCWYREHPHPDKVTLMVQRQEGLPLEVGAWVQHGYASEFEIVRFDEHGVPLDSKMRGWRTVLLQLILKGIVTEEVTHKAFGEATGPASKRYNALLCEWRNRRMAVSEESN